MRFNEAIAEHLDWGWLVGNISLHVYVSFSRHCLNVWTISATAMLPVYNVPVVDAFRTFMACPPPNIAATLHQIQSVAAG